MTTARRRRRRRAVAGSLAALLVVVVVAFALDGSHQPPGCRFVESPTGRGSFVANRVCPGRHPARAAHGTPSYRAEVLTWLGLVLLVALGIVVVPLAIRLEEDLAVRRSRRR